MPIGSEFHAGEINDFLKSESEKEFEGNKEKRKERGKYTVQKD